MVGFIIALPYIYLFVGGWDGLVSKVTHNLSDIEALAKYFSMDGIGVTMIIGYIVMLVPSFFISPGLIGKVFSAKDERSVKIGTAANGVVQLIFAICPVFIGMAAFASFPGISNADLALPTAMKEMMPFTIATLALAAIFAAEVSTADAVLYMISSSISNDLYKTFINPKISDGSLLKLSRAVTLISGIMGVFLALNLESIISALTIFYSLMSVSLAAPLIFGLFTRRASNMGAIISSICGVSLSIFCTFYKSATPVYLFVGTLDTTTKLVDFGITKLNATTCGIIFAFAAMAISTILLPSKAEPLDDGPITPVVNS
jgi:SSS family solute:Na+ symporter